MASIIYQFVSNEGHWCTLGNNPDWLLYSAEHQFYRLDPSLIHPQYYTTSSICFPKYHEHEQFQQTLVFQAVDLFDIDHTLAFIDYVPGSCDGNVLKSVIQARITAASTDSYTKKL